MRLSANNAAYQLGSPLDSQSSSGGNAPVELVSDMLGIITSVSETYAFIGSDIGGVFMPGSAYLLRRVEPCTLLSMKVLLLKLGSRAGMASRRDLLPYLPKATSSRFRLDLKPKLKDVDGWRSRRLRSPRSWILPLVYFSYLSIYCYCSMNAVH